MKSNRKSLKRRTENAAKPKNKKVGYRVMFQTGMSDEQFRIAWNFLIRFKESTAANKGYWNGHTRGGHDSYLARNECGLSLSGKPDALLFRRVSNRKRIFGIVKNNTIKLIKTKSKNNIEITKWVWADGKPPEMYTVFETGEIQGQ